MVEDVVDVRITVSEKGISVFQGLFAEGVLIHSEPGQSLSDILCRRIGIPENYLHDRVQTVFLNGRAVDDFSGEPVRNNAVIALSAAMPGLVGAVFRKKGMLSPLRTFRLRQSKDSVFENYAKETGLNQITLKLFNLIAAELAPEFLNNGILINKDQLLRYVDWKKAFLKKTCKALTVDGRPAEIDDLAVFLEEAEHVRLFANVDQ